MSSSEGQKNRSEAVISSISSTDTESSSSTPDTHCLRAGRGGRRGWARYGQREAMRGEAGLDGARLLRLVSGWRRIRVPNADPPSSKGAVVPADVEEHPALRIAASGVLLHVRALVRFRERPRPAVGRVPQELGAVAIAIGWTWPRETAGQQQRPQRPPRAGPWSHRAPWSALSPRPAQKAGRSWSHCAPATSGRQLLTIRDPASGRPGRDCKG